jgi:hypothetical protein
MASTLRRLKGSAKHEEEIVDSARTEDIPDEKSIGRADIAAINLDDYEEEHYKLPPETAEDFVTEVIHARDDPTLNPWTFRTFFLGKANMYLAKTVLTLSRHWVGFICIHSCNDLLLQASNGGCFHSLHSCYQLCAW